MVQVRLELNEYTVRVLDVIKGKYGLKNRSEAIDRFAILKGEEYVEPEIDPEYAKELNRILKQHEKKGFKKMSKEEFDELFA